jgi:hypothetical protein
LFNSGVPIPADVVTPDCCWEANDELDILAGFKSALRPNKNDTNIAERRKIIPPIIHIAEEFLGDVEPEPSPPDEFILVGDSIEEFLEGPDAPPLPTVFVPVGFKVPPALLGLGLGE